MKNLILSVFFYTLLVNILHAQPPSVQWLKCYGGNNIDYGYAICAASNGDYIVTGYTQSNNADVSGLHNTFSNNPDYWVVRLDNSGNIKWQKCIGGSINDYANSIAQTKDGGFIIAGSSNSSDADVSGNHGQLDCWIVKIDSLGAIKWQNNLGGSANDGANSIQQTNDGGYIFIGSTSSNNGDVTGNHGNSDYWAVKLDSLGNLKWQKCLGGTGYDIGNSIDQTEDGGYIILGTTGSTDGNVTGNHNSADYWIVKLDSLGTIQWQKCYGGTDNDQGCTVKQTADKGYIMNGYVFSFDGDVTNPHPGSADYWVVKADSVGNIKWQKCLGGSMNDEGTSALQTADKGFIVTGNTLSNDGDITSNFGGSDFWVIKLDSMGTLSWQENLGGTGDEYARDLAITFDGGIVLVGNTNSNNGNVSGNHGGDDYWVVKLDNVVGIKSFQNEITFNVYPNPSNGLFSLKSSKEIGSVSIYNTLGEKVLQQKTKENTISLDISQQPPGIYFLHAQGQVMKIVKE